MGRRGPRLIGRRTGFRDRDDTRPQVDVRIVRSSKVFKTHKGGKTASWSIVVVVGDNKGRIGVGMGKARGIPDSIRKGEDAARANMFSVPLIGETIPHEVVGKWGASTVILKPASPGTGVKAGSSVRHCLEALGVKNVLAKCLGSRNPVNMTRAVFDALNQLRAPEETGKTRGMDANELVPWLESARKEEALNA